MLCVNEAATVLMHTITVSISTLWVGVPSRFSADAADACTVAYTVNIQYSHYLLYSHLLDSDGITAAACKSDPFPDRRDRLCIFPSAQFLFISQQCEEVAAAFTVGSESGIAN